MMDTKPDNRAEWEDALRNFVARPAPRPVVRRAQIRRIKQARPKAACTQTA